MSLIEVPRPEGNYIILEGISREKKVSKGLYIIHNLFTDEDSVKLVKNVVFFHKISQKHTHFLFDLKMLIFLFKSIFQGRGHQCDVRVQDISVSRCHSYIKFLSS